MSNTEQRWASKRAKWLQSYYDLRGSKAVVLAYSELGYSSSGIPRASGELTKATVKKILDEVEAEFGIEATFPVPDDERVVDRELPGGGDDE